MRENPVKIAVLVSGGGTNLQALIDAQNSGIIKSGKIELVIANNANAFALERGYITEKEYRMVSAFQSNPQDPSWIDVQ